MNTSTDGSPTSPDTVDGEISLTVDELARSVDMSVRNLREWRTLGLLPAPTMVGRSGRYGADVLKRVRTIQRLHDDGFPLDLIRKLLDGDDELSEDIVRLAAAIRGGLREQQDPGGSPLERAGRVGETLARMGLSGDQIVDATTTVGTHVTAIAEVFEKTWLDHVWEPFVARGMPLDERPELEKLLTEMPDRAVDAVVALFTVAISERIDVGIEREAKRALEGE